MKRGWSIIDPGGGYTINILQPHYLRTKHGVATSRRNALIIRKSRQNSHARKRVDMTFGGCHFGKQNVAKENAFCL